MKRLVLGAALLALVAGFSTAHAQFPERPVTMIVPFPPGGVADTVGRPIAEAMGAALKQPVKHQGPWVLGMLHGDFPGGGDRHVCIAQR